MESCLKPTFDEKLKPGADDLLVFVDDTGHETFADNQGFYGLGGCVLLGAGHVHLKERWRAVGNHPRPQRASQ
jgi:hypothetical protein